MFKSVKSISILIISVLIGIGTLSPVSSAATLAEENFSTENDGIFRSFKIYEGLSQSTVQDVLLDSAGRLWIGTQDGLDRYRPGGFTYYKYNDKNSDSVSDNTIMKLFEDTNGTVWVGTLNGGLNVYDPKTDTFKRHYLYNEKSEVVGKNIRDIAEGRDKTLYVATSDGLFKKAHDEVTFEAVKSLNIYAEALCATSDNTLYLATQEGLKSYRKGEGAKVYSPEGLKGVSALDITPFDETHLLVQIGDTNLQLFDTISKKFTPFTLNHEKFKQTSNLTELFKDTKGNLWIGTYDQGVFQYNPRSGSVKNFSYNPEEPFSIAHNAIRKIYEDSRGQIWIGTYLNGVSIYSYERQVFHVVRNNFSNPQSLLDNTVRGFAYDLSRKGLWVASSKGFSFWNKNLAQYEHYSGENGKYPISQSGSLRGMYQSRDNQIFGFSWSGISLYNPSKNIFEPYQPKVDKPYPIDPSLWYALHIDSDGYEYIGCDTGLLIRAPGETHYELFNRNERDSRGLVDNFVTRFFEDKEGRVWISTTHGISIYDKKAKQFVNLVKTEGSANGLQSNYVFSFYEDEAYYWLGTQGGGISRVTKDLKTFKNFGEAEGLPNSTAYALLPDGEGHLFVSSNNGIYKFNKTSGQVTAFNEYDGVQSREFNNYAYWQAEDGTVFLGGISGFNYFNPRSIKDSASEYLVTFDQIRTNGSTVDLLTKRDSEGIIHLNYKQRDISFEFYTLDFASDNKVKYSYCMEGYDQQWSSPSSKKIAEYTNLPDGTYHFRVRAVDYNGNSAEHEMVQTIIIEKPPWKKGWAIILYVIGLIGLLVGARKFLKYKSLKVQAKFVAENERLEHLINLRTKDLIRANEQLEIHANYDKLTGLYNRRKIDEILSEKVKSSLLKGKPLALIICDIDHFKEVNDRYGHHMGDLVLSTVAERLKNTLQCGFIGRWGGEEFVVVLPETTGDEAFVVAEQMRTAVKAIHFDNGLNVTISMGVSEHKIGMDSQDLVIDADKNLYLAKSKGRDRTVF